MVLSALGLRRRTGMSSRSSSGSGSEADLDLNNINKLQGTSNNINLSTLASDSTLVEDAVEERERERYDEEEEEEGMAKRGDYDISDKVDLGLKGNEKGKERERESLRDPRPRFNSLHRRPRPRRTTTLTQDADSESDSTFGYDLSIVIALVSPIGNWLTGGDHVKNVLLMLLLIFYLHQVIEVPWSLYQTSLPRRVPHPSQAEAHTQAHSSLTTLSHIYLLLSILSPFMGAMLLHTVARSITGSEHSLSWFSTALFVLATGVRPWKHLVRRLRMGSVELQEVLKEGVRDRRERDQDQDQDDDDEYVEERLQSIQTHLSLLTTRLDMLTNQMNISQRSSIEQQSRVSEIESRLADVVGVLERCVVGVVADKRRRRNRDRYREGRKKRLGFGELLWMIVYPFIILWEHIMGFLANWNRNWNLNRDLVGEFDADSDVDFGGDSDTESDGDGMLSRLTSSPLEKGTQTRMRNANNSRQRRRGGNSNSNPHSSSHTHTHSNPHSHTHTQSLQIQTQSQTQTQTEEHRNGIALCVSHIGLRREANPNSNSNLSSSGIGVGMGMGMGMVGRMKRLDSIPEEENVPSLIVNGGGGVDGKFVDGEIEMERILPPSLPLLPLPLPISSSSSSSSIIYPTTFPNPNPNSNPNPPKSHKSKPHKLTSTSTSTLFYTYRTPLSLPSLSLSVPVHNLIRLIRVFVYFVIVGLFRPVFWVLSGLRGGSGASVRRS